MRLASEPFSYPASLREGQLASVMYTVFSGDLPINICWTKDGETISESNPDTAGILVNTVSGFTSTLFFKALRLEYRGNYTCVAQNDAGRASHSAVMVIHARPYVSKMPRQTRKLTLGCGFGSVNAGDDLDGFASVASPPLHSIMVMLSKAAAGDDVAASAIALPADS
ncbi:hypothetical protein HPB52_010036 [Rhipicephalus sanguineus]|uniref:Ig-like domain-containing protein n=1 Tax=Rhipicephalus sanguineus TaxID=34632 RepID=A0A9D4Q6Q9_RHISA|nr:hypothetical protein HPB52_010036 [Rhipicephalus sanguineus]